MPDILDSITAIHSREERYARLELLYRSQEEREKIFEAIRQTTCPKECQMEITDMPKSEEGGIVSIEFHDDYDKEAGDFFDRVIGKLGIDRCF